MVGTRQRDGPFEGLIHPHLVRLSPRIIELIQGHNVAMRLRIIRHLTSVEVDGGSMIVLILFTHQRVQEIPFGLKFP